MQHYLDKVLLVVLYAGGEDLQGVRGRRVKQGAGRPGTGIEGEHFKRLTGET